MQITDGVPPANPNTADAWGSRGFEKAHAGLQEETVQEYDNKLRTNFHSAPLWYNRGVALDRLGREEEAPPLLRKCPECGSGDVCGMVQ
ncbi:MAG: hypothetical protein WCF90_00575 [Methanomicrobiales archaeon]